MEQALKNEKKYIKWQTKNSKKYYIWERCQSFIAAPKSIGPPTRQYYERKTAEGKHPLCVINAVKNKLVLRAVAVIKSQTAFVDNFTKTNETIKNAA